MSTRNAADIGQVKESENREKRQREQELNDVRAVLSTIHGRRFYWRMMKQCRTFESIWEPSAKIHYNSGRQDFGHFLLAELNDSTPETYLQMMKENKEGEFNV